MALAPAPLAPRTVKFPFPFHGYNSNPASIDIDDKSFSPFPTNHITFRRGRITTLPAYAAWAQTAGAPGVVSFTGTPSGATSFVASNGVAYPIVGTSGFLYHYHAGLDNWIAFDTAPSGTDVERNWWSFAVISDNLYSINNRAVVKVFNPVTNSTTPLTPSQPFTSPIVFSYAGRLVFLDITELNALGVSTGYFSDRIRWSSYLAPTTLDIGVGGSTAGAADYTDVPGTFTGAAVLGTYAWLFKRDAIIRMAETGFSSPPFSFQAVVPGVGSLYPRTIIPVDTKIFFLGSDANVYTFDGGSAPVPIGDAIRHELADHLDTVLASTNKLSYYPFRIWSLWSPNTHEYQLYIYKDSITPGAMYAYNYAERSWSRHDGVLYPAAGHYRTIDGLTTDIWDGATGTWDTDTAVWDSGLLRASLNNTFYADGSAGGLNTWKPDPSATTIGRSATAGFVTPDWHCDLPGRLKTLLAVRVQVLNLNNATLALTASVDGGASATSMGNATLTASGTPTSVTTLRFPITRLTGEFFRLTLSSSSRFSIVGVEADVIDRGPVK